METKFNSQICTTREQSERLLELGLKPGTADMCWLDFALTSDYDDWRVEPIYKDWEDWQKYGIPAWSLHRLIEMMPRTIKANDDLFFLLVSKEDVFYDNTEGTAYSSFINRNGLYYNIISCIEWLIKEGYFNKEYLV